MNGWMDGQSNYYMHPKKTLKEQKTNSVNININPSDSTLWDEGCEIMGVI